MNIGFGMGQTCATGRKTRLPFNRLHDNGGMPKTTLDGFGRRKPWTLDCLDDEFSNDNDSKFNEQLALHNNTQEQRTIDEKKCVIHTQTINERMSWMIHIMNGKIYNKFPATYERVQHGVLYLVVPFVTSWKYVPVE
jgi:hypothetical protein